MERTIGISKLKATLGAVIRSLETGDELTITNRGVVVARLVRARPDEPELSRYERMRLAGRIKRGKPSGKPLFEDWTPLDLPPGLLQRLLDEDREDRF